MRLTQALVGQTAGVEPRERLAEGPPDAVATAATGNPRTHKRPLFVLKAH